MNKGVVKKSRQSLKAGEVRCNVDLPISDLSTIEQLAAAERMTRKPYMEKVLIEHAKTKKQ